MKNFAAPKIKFFFFEYFFLIEKYQSPILNFTCGALGGGEGGGIWDVDVDV